MHIVRGLWLKRDRPMFIMDHGARPIACHHNRLPKVRPKYFSHIWTFQFVMMASGLTFTYYAILLQIAPLPSGNLFTLVSWNEQEVALARA
jgi:hypothetical protein